MSSSQQNNQVWALNTIPLDMIIQDFGSARLDKAMNGRDLSVNGNIFAHGIGTLANSEISLKLDGHANMLHGFCGVDDISEFIGGADFIIRNLDNGQILWQSGVMQRNENIKEFSINLDGIKKIAFQIISCNDGHGHFYGDWINVKINYTDHLPQPFRNEMILETKNLQWSFHAIVEQVLHQTSFGLKNVPGKVQDCFFTPPGRWYDCEVFIKPDNFRIIQADGAHDLELHFRGLEQEQISENVKKSTFSLSDDDYPIQVEYIVTSYFDEDVFTAQTVLRNNGNENIMVLERDSVCVALPKKSYYITNFNGNWGREMGISESLLPRGIVEHRNTSMGHNTVPDYPGMFLSADHKADENCGEVFAAAIAYSSRWQYKITRTECDDVFFSAGVCGDLMTLLPQDSTVSPVVIMSYSAAGKGQISRNLHQWSRRYWFTHAQETRPVVLNSWEGVMFDFDEAKIIRMMHDAAAAGIEMYVLDDGWFGNKYPRNLDNAGLGDWEINQTKLPGGLDHLIEECNSLGMKFGLWFEPEMINPRSELFEKHPEWVMRNPKRRLISMRNQYMLDLSIKEVEEYVFESVAKYLRRYPKIAYIKWDQNMPPMNAGAVHLGQNQGKLAQLYNDAYYRILSRLNQEFPTVMFQLCASGGGRVDFGAMHYHGEFWASDVTNGILRIPIQWGFSHFFPSENIAAHISKSGDGDFKLRVDVAMTARLGVELSPDSISEESRLIIQKGIAEYKKLRPLLHSANLYRGRSPHESAITEMTFVAPDKTQAVFFGFKRNTQAEKVRLKLSGLKPEASYAFSEVNIDNEPRIESGILTGEQLNTCGVAVNFPDKYSSVVIYLKEISK